MTAGDIIVVRGNTWGKKGNYFDGTDDYVLHDAHAVARVAGNDTTGTYSAWIFVDTPITAANKSILSAGDNNSDTEFFSIDINTNGQLQARLKQGGSTQWAVRETTASITGKTWTHVAVVQNGTQPELYVNGILMSRTNSTATDLTMWYDELTGCDKFAIGVLESNATHTQDFNGAIGQVKYWNKALTAAEVLADFKGEALDDDGTYLQLNVTMENDGTTDSGLGADNGTLTGGAIYGGEISEWSYLVNEYVTGHAAEALNTFLDGNKAVTIIRRGD